MRQTTQAEHRQREGEPWGGKEEEDYCDPPFSSLVSPSNLWSILHRSIHLTGQGKALSMKAIQSVRQKT